MKILYLKAKNIKSIPENCDLLTFYKEEKNTKKPVSTIILGDNGSSKSTFIEVLALLSHVNIMEVCKDDPREAEDPSFIEIKVSLSNNYTGILVFAAKENTRTDSKFSKKTAGFLSSHIVDEALIDKHWCVFYPKDNPGNFTKNYLKTLLYSRPPHSISADREYGEIKAIANCNRNTPRAQKLFHLDTFIDPNDPDPEIPKEIEKNLREQGTITLINTDMNDFGLGLNIFESPKNIKSDLAVAIHYRLPCTRKDGSLRNLKKLNKYWKQIFSEKEITKVICEKEKYGKSQTLFNIKRFHEDITDIETLSSGENEAFFVLSTILSLELYNSVLLLDEPELHMGIEQLQAYYKTLFKLAEDYKLQLIIVTHQPFILEEQINQVEFRLLKPTKDKLSIWSDRDLIEEHICEPMRKHYAGPVSRGVFKYVDGNK